MTNHTETAGTRKRTPPMRWVLYTGWVLGGIAGAVMLINSYDPALHPAASEAMGPRPSIGPHSENAYFVHYGLGVPRSEDPHAHGVRLVQASEALERMVPIDETEVNELAKQNQVHTWRGKTGGLCGHARSNCLDAFAKQRSQIDTLVNENVLRLERYRSLYRYKTFSEIGFHRLDIPYPDFARAEHETVLAEIGLKALDENVEGACLELVRDTGYWRRVLAGASTLVTKTVAADQLGRNYALASEILARYGERATPLGEMTKSMTADERSWARPLESEFRALAHLYVLVREQTGQGVFSREAQWWDRFLTWAFYRPNATINLQYRYFERLQPLMDISARELADTANALQRRFEVVVDLMRMDMVYNPVGKLLVAIATPSPESYARYIGRVHNLDGQIRLLRLQVQIVNENRSGTDIADVIENAPVGLLDPYREQPFRFESSPGEIWFEGIDPSGDGTSPSKRIGVQI